MDRSPLESNSNSASQETSRPLWNVPCSQELATGSHSEPDESSPYRHTHLISLRSSLISHLCLGLPNDLFPSGFPTNIFYAFLISPMHATWPPISS